METDREAWIKKRAHEIWEESGKPDGSGERHWQQASAEWAALHPGSSTARARVPTEEEKAEILARAVGFAGDAAGECGAKD